MQFRTTFRISFSRPRTVPLRICHGIGKNIRISVLTAVNEQFSRQILTALKRLEVITNVGNVWYVFFFKFGTKVCHSGNDDALGNQYSRSNKPGTGHLCCYFTPRRLFENLNRKLAMILDTRFETIIHRSNWGKLKRGRVPFFRQFGLYVVQIFIAIVYFKGRR